MYVLNQKINNLEEKVSVIDNFSQSIFNFVTSAKEEVKEVTYSNNNVKPAQVPVNTTNDVDAESESESEPNKYDVNNVEVDTSKSETGESKELLSEMVAELKESLIQTNTENLNNDLSLVQELKEELKEESSTNNELYTLLNTTEIKIMDTPVVESVKLSGKKKEEELMKMNLNDLKSLAKKKNIPVMVSNKPKKKEVLIQDLLQAT